MIPMEWFLLNVDVVGEEDTVNLYEDETQGGLVTVRSASIKRNGPGGRIQELGVPGCGTFAFEYGSDGKLVDYTYDGDEAWDSCVPDGSSLTPPRDPDVAFFYAEEANHDAEDAIFEELYGTSTTTVPPPGW